jgi:hypothetical protein
VKDRDRGGGARLVRPLQIRPGRLARRSRLFRPSRRGRALRYIFLERDLFLRDRVRPIRGFRLRAPSLDEQVSIRGGALPQIPRCCQGRKIATAIRNRCRRKAEAPLPTNEENWAMTERSQIRRTARRRGIAPSISVRPTPLRQPPLPPADDRVHLSPDRHTMQVSDPLSVVLSLQSSRPSRTTGKASVKWKEG